jgi:ABC-2 type transport system ATP-binding protein
VNLLEARHLRKSYDGNLAVADVSFELNRGEVLGLLGPNGAGKSTTMLMLAGLLKPDAGQVLIDGDEVCAGRRSYRFQLGVTPQELAIYPELSALENLKFFGKLYGIRGKGLDDRCQEVLEQIGLADRAHEPSRSFSGGMKRRLNFGVSIMHRPSILILDEPTVGVDPQSRAHLLECVQKLASGGVGVIYASHYMEEVQAICRRVAIIDHGQMLAYDTVPNLLAQLPSGLCLMVNDVARLNGQLKGLATTMVRDGQPMVVLSGEPAEINQQLPTVLFRLQAAGATLERIETQQPNLERLFLQLTGRKLRD